MVVIERPVKVPSELLWLVLLKVSIDNQNQKASVEELSQEHLPRNGGLLNALRVLPNPNGELNDDLLEYDVHCHNDKGNGLSYYLRPQLFVAEFEVFILSNLHYLTDFMSY